MHRKVTAPPLKYPLHLTARKCVTNKAPKANRGRFSCRLSIILRSEQKSQTKQRGQDHMIFSEEPLNLNGGRARGIIHPHHQGYTHPCQPKASDAFKINESKKILMNIFPC